MDLLWLLALILLACLPLFHLLSKSRRRSKRLPPGSLGIPIIGQSLSFLKAMRENKAEDYVARRIEKYGPISKLHLFGTPTILLTGPAANKFAYTNTELSSQQPTSLRRVLGERCLPELAVEEHRRVRGAISQFLRPEVLKNYVGTIDRMVRDHLEKNWIGRHTVTVFPLMKSLTFDIICATMFGIEEGPCRDGLLSDFEDVVTGAVAVPLDLPFTSYNKSLKARRRVEKVLTGVIKERRAAFKQGNCNFNGDLISYMISLGEKDEMQSLSEEEIVDNAIFVMVAGFDTSSILVTFMIRELANNPVILAEMVREQEEIVKSKTPAEYLTWEDLSKMKFTWCVAMETLRMVPPLFGNFRRALKDIEFNGYLIPKGWQVCWSASVTHMNDDIFREPWKFDPTRFEKKSSIPPYSFVAFGGGPRVCPGAELARIETLVMMHHVVTLFSWKLCGKAHLYRREPMPSPWKGLPIQLESSEAINAASN